MAPQVHRFSTTSEAYGESQTSDDIHSGDVLIATKEGVYGFLNRAWPIAVIGGPGAFHSLEPGYTPEDLDGGKFAESVALCRKLAREELGTIEWPAEDPAFDVYVRASDGTHKIGEGFNTREEARAFAEKHQGPLEWTSQDEGVSQFGGVVFIETGGKKKPQTPAPVDFGTKASKPPRMSKTAATPVPTVAPSASSGGLSVVPGDQGQLDVGGKVREMIGTVSHQMRYLWQATDALVKRGKYAELSKLAAIVGTAAGQVQELSQTAKVANLRSMGAEDNPLLSSLTTSTELESISRYLEKADELVAPIKFQMDRSEDWGKPTERGDFLSEVAHWCEETARLNRYSQFLVNRKSKQEGKVAETFIDYLAKFAEDLEAIDTPVAAQAVEGIDAALIACQSGVDDCGVLSKVAAVAAYLDEVGEVEAADLLDKISLAYHLPEDEPKVPSRSETRKDLYDYEAHNRETQDRDWDRTKAEIQESRKEHHNLSMRGKAPSLSTRYSPELPGVPMIPVSQGVWQDAVSKRIYDFNKGFTTSDGQKWDGGGVQNQTPSGFGYAATSPMFESRQDVKNRQRG